MIRRFLEKRLDALTEGRIPHLTIEDVGVMFQEEEDDCATLTLKGILQKPPELAGYTFRVEMGIPSSRLDQLCSLLLSLPHENIVQAYARGDDFLVTSFWNETLRCYLRRIEKEMSENQGPLVKIRLRRKGGGTIDLWRSVALPIINVVSFLHAENVTLGGALDLTTIVLNTQNGDDSKDLLSLPTQIYLRDFSKAHQASFTAMDQLYQTEFLSEDVFQLGTVLSEISLIQRLPSGEAAERMDDMIDMCCHSDPCKRPSARRVQKTLLDILHHTDRGATARARSDAPSFRGLETSNFLSSPKISRRRWFRGMFPFATTSLAAAIPKSSQQAVPSILPALEEGSSSSCSDISEKAPHHETTTPSTIRQRIFARRPFGSRFSGDSVPKTQKIPAFPEVQITVAIARGNDGVESTSSDSSVALKETAADDTQSPSTLHSRHQYDNNCNASTRTTSTANTCVHRNGKAAASSSLRPRPPRFIFHTNRSRDKN
jgi:hypothetical protein